MNRLLRQLLPIVLTGLCSVGCSEIYVPEVNPQQGALVVQGLLTDGAGPFNIHLSQARPYNSDSTAKTAYVADASLYVTDSEGHTVGLHYRSNGNYELPDTFRTVTGRSYVLHIATADGETYESDPQQLLPAETIDTLYTTYATKDYLNQLNELKTVWGYDIRADLFNRPDTTNPKPLCRFESNIVVQYLYTLEDIDETHPYGKEWYWFTFGWGTYNLNETANITDERAKTSSAEIKRHLLCFMPKDPNVYGLVNYPTMSCFYYFRYHQYTLNEDSYRFYEAANKQLSASGKLFDPITSQLLGNIRCTSRPEKVALGLFEVSSVRSGAYIIARTAMKAPYTDKIPTFGGATYKAYKDGRVTDDPEFEVVPYPSWWSHSR